MRAALPFKVEGASGNAAYGVEVLATVLRDYYLRVSVAGGTYTVDVFPTYADAVAQTSKVATGTHAAGGPQVVVLSAAPGAPFTATPMSLVVTAAGTWTLRIMGWVAGVQAALLSRMEAILARYAATDEVLDGIAYAGISLDLPQGLPCYGIGPKPSPTEPFDTNAFHSHIAVDLYAAFEGYTPATVLRCTAVGEALRSIALDEQRTWGGFAVSTNPAGPLMPAVDREGGGITFSTTQGLVIEVPDMISERDPSTLLVGTGGKYVVGL